MFLGFLGTHSPRLDEKGRLVLPARFREEFAAGIVLTKGHERCLYAYPRREFERIYTQVESAPVTDRRARDYRRVLFSGAAEEVPDKQGRVTIPPQLRDYADLDRDLSVIGSGSYVEIWDAAAWAAYIEQAEPVFSDTSEEVVPGRL